MKTQRGFEIQHFKDDYGLDCSIQESSSFEPHIWLGVDKPVARIMYKDAIGTGFNVYRDHPGDNDLGWCTIPLPPKTLIDSRMHLSRKQAKQLAKKLNFFARRGYLKAEDE